MRSGRTYKIMTKENSKRRSEARLRGYLRVTPALLFSLALLPGCLTRQEVDAELWLHMGIPAKLCTDNPALTRYGIYRLLNTGESEFVSYCTRLPNPNPSASPIAAIENY